MDDLSDAVLALLEIAIPNTDSASLSRRSPVPIKAVPSGLETASLVHLRIVLEDVGVELGRGSW